MNKQEKFKVIADVGKVLDKQFDSTTFQRQGNRVFKAVPCLPTNLASVDREVIGCGGLPKGRIIEIYGAESAGKTAFSLHCIGQCQQAGGVASFVDAEHALSPTFANTLGVNMDELIISQPDYGEQALEIVEALVDSQAVDLIVVDSVAALTPKAEMEGEMGDSHMGLHARLMSQAMRKLYAKVAKTGAVIIFINQVREKVGLVFGNPEVTPGGRGLKFAASLRLEVRRVAASKGGTLLDADKHVYGHRMNIKAVKNKVDMPFRETIVELHYATGFQTSEDLIDHALKIGVLTGTSKFVIKGTEQKFSRGDIPMGALKAAVEIFYQEKVNEKTLQGLEENSTEA